jgi:hypothetical protein
MGFLIRSAFWLSLVLLVVPFDSGEAGSEGNVSAFEALDAAREALGDVKGMCERKPDVCVTAEAALETIGLRAREGAKIAYEVLDERFGGPIPPADLGAAPDGQTTGGIERQD